MDDILREQVGKTCHAYMDDIIIFSKIEQHYKDLIVIINILRCFSQCNQNRPRKNIYNFKISNSKKHSRA